MSKNTTCGQRIKEALTLRKMRQADLCKITGINKTLISHYVHGHFMPKMGNLHEMAKALKVSETWLMGYDDNINKGDDQ